MKLLIEASMLCLFSTLIALTLSVWGIKFIQYLGQGTLPRLAELHIDTYTIAFALFISLFISMLFSFLPLSLLKQHNLSSELQSSGKGIGKQVSQGIRSFLVAGQLLLVTLLLCFASLFLQHAWQELEKGTGFDISNRTITILGFTKKTNSTGVREQALKTLMKVLKQVDGVLGVTLSSADPVTMATVFVPIKNSAQAKTVIHAVGKVQRNFFDVLNIPFLVGNSFSKNNYNHEPEVVLNKTAAKSLLLHPWISGSHILISNTAYRVVGIIGDTYLSPERRQHGQSLIFVRYQHLGALPLPSEKLTLITHNRVNLPLNKAKIIQLIKKNSLPLRVNSFSELSLMLSRAVYLSKLSASLAVAFALLTLLLAAVGIWGIVNYNAKMRCYELAIRMSLGAKEKHLQVMMFKDNGIPVLFGTISGLCLSYIVLTLLPQFEQYVKQADWRYFYFMLILMLFTVCLSIYIPIRKLISKTPMTILKAQ